MRNSTLLSRSIPFSRPNNQELIPATSSEADNLWRFLLHTERCDNTVPEPPPFIKASVQVMETSIPFLLPTESTFFTLIERVRSAFCRHCLSVENITETSPVQVTGPIGIQALVFNDQELGDVLDEFLERVELQQIVMASNDLSILQPPEELWSYEIIDFDELTTIPQVSCTSPDKNDDDFKFQPTYEDLYRDSGVIDIELSMW